MTLHLFKASPVVDPTPDLHIEATETIPEGGSLDESRLRYRADAVALVDALRQSLPGGTIDAILVELLSRKVSLLRIPMDAPPRGGA